VPHLHLGVSTAVTVFLLWLLVALPLKVLAISPLLHNTRFGQALYFALA